MIGSIAKKAVLRGGFSFASTVAVTEVLMLFNTYIAMTVTKDPQVLPLVPDYAAYFSNPYIALNVQVLLCGLIGMSFGCCSVIMELERWSMVKQAVVHFALTAVVWIPVSVFCWGLGRYRSTLVSVGISLFVTYAVTWIIRIAHCRREVRKINQRILELNGE